MIAPTQYLIHVTNRGPETHAQVSGDPGRYKVFMKQPLKDINKFGLMMYSIPKTLDIVQPNNQNFQIIFGFASGDEVMVNVTLPMLDYYDMYLSQELDRSGTNGGDGLTEGRVRSKLRLSFDEVLQTTINWAIMQQFENPLLPHIVGPNWARLCDCVMARLGCIVEFDKPTGCYKFTFGYRGIRTIINPGTVDQDYGDAVRAISGAPMSNRAWVAPGGNDPRTVGILAGNGAFQFIAPSNNYYSAAGGPGQPVWIPASGLNGYDPVAQSGGDTLDNYNAIRLTSVTFANVSQRLQLMLGLSDKNTFSTVQQVNGVNMTKQRGRIVLVNYNAQVNGDAANALRPTGMVEFLCPIPPNLDPPSFLYLQLLVPGTRSKILGQSDERGGWALPTTQNLYMSKYDNLPMTYKYDPLSARLMPAVLSEQNYNDLFAPGETVMPPGGGPPVVIGAGEDGPGYNFDPIPMPPNVVMGRIPDRNYSLVGNDRSRMIMIGGVGADGTRNTIEAGARKRLRSNFDTGVFVPRMGAFGVGALRASTCFTTSLIEPNWLFTSVENTTMQTVDVQLMFGDTSETVDTITGQPVQFTFIASP